jgi:hypothetical protein
MSKIKRKKTEHNHRTFYKLQIECKTKIDNMYIPFIYCAENLVVFIFAIANLPHFVAPFSMVINVYKHKTYQ